MQIISTINSFVQLQGTSYNKKKNNFTFCLGKSRENSINIFQDFTNKIQGLSKTFQDSKKNPGLFQDVATLCLTALKASTNPSLTTFFLVKSILVPITNIASLQLKAKVEWFSEQKAEGFQDGSFRNDYLCLLVLASYLVVDVPDNLKYFLEYRQEEISHSRWITTASGYPRLLIFGLGNFGIDQKKKNVQNFLVYCMRLRAIFYAYPFKANSIRRAFSHAIP